MYGWQGTILRVDLTTGEIKKEPLSKEMAVKYLGGGGLNARLLFDEVKKDTDPMGPDNAVIFGVGPLVGTLVPSASRVTITAKAPLSGSFGDTNAGGQFGAEMKFAGYDHIIIKGKAKEPVYLWIDSDNVEIRSARHLWGKDTWETDDLIKAELGDEHIKTAVVGHAAEIGIRFAGITVSRFHGGFRGGGIGAAMGAKNLKAVAVRGNKSVKMANPEAMVKLYDEAMASYEAHPGTKLFEKDGTMMLIPIYTKMGTLATRAGQSFVVSPEKAEAWGPKPIAEKYETGKRACFGCRVACSCFHEFTQGPYAGLKAERIETVTAIAMNAYLDMPTIEPGIYMSDMCSKYGVDGIEMGSLLGIAFYWYQKGLLKKEDAYGLELEWGNEKAAVELFFKILNQEKGLGELLSMGVQRALDKMGPDYAVPQGAIKGVSAAMTDVRIGKSWGLGFAVSPRGADHLKSFAVLQWQPAPTIMKITGSEKAINPTIEEDKHLVTAWSGNYSTVLDSIGVCKQPTIHDFGAYPTDLIAKMFSAVTGVEMTFEQLMKAGERNWNVMRLFNTRQGLTRKDDTLPAGMSSVPKPDGAAKGLSLNLDKMLDQYYPYMGWDNNGIPTREKLEELGLADMADQLGIKKKAAKEKEKEK